MTKYSKKIPKVHGVKISAKESLAFRHAVLKTAVKSFSSESVRQLIRSYPDIIPQLLQQQAGEGEEEEQEGEGEGADKQHVDPEYRKPGHWGDARGTDPGDIVYHVYWDHDPIVPRCEWGHVSMKEGPLKCGVRFYVSAQNNELVPDCKAVNDYTPYVQRARDMAHSWAEALVCPDGCEEKLIRDEYSHWWCTTKEEHESIPGHSIESDLVSAQWRVSVLCH